MASAASAAVLGGSQLLVTWRSSGGVAHGQRRRRWGATPLLPCRPPGGRGQQRCFRMSAAGPDSSYRSNNKGLRQKLAAAVLAPALAVTLALGSPSSAALAAADTATAPTPTQQSAESSSTRMSYSRLLDYIDEGRVTKVDLYGNDRVALVELKEPELNKVRKVAVSLPRVPGSTRELMRKSREHNVNVAAHRIEQEAGPAGVFVDLLINLLFPGLLIGSLFLLSRRNQGGPSGPRGGPGGGGGPFNPMNFGKSKAKFQLEPKTGVKFEDVAGVDEAKMEFMEVVEFLKNPQRFTSVGARIPKGVLLTGPPGTGKTLLAKAIAGEAGVPFVSMSGSEFVEMFVGVGASRVRDLFNTAKQNAPCIVFVDEIDAIGRQRGAGLGVTNDEREQTLNQLLSEMDGFVGNTGVIVVAATNRADILDRALLRPGRFDRQVSVDLPDAKGREAILKVHAKNKLLGKDVDLTSIALRTPGFSGADLANLLNEAAILAGRRGKDAVSDAEVEDALDRIVSGLEGVPLSSGKNKTLMAYHEVGKALVASLTPGHDPVQKVSLVPRGQRQSLTLYAPSEDPSLISKSQLFARIVAALGGRAAEETVFGESEMTTVSGNELRYVSQLAKQMVTVFGMSEIGPWSLQDPSSQSPDLIMRTLARNSMSEKLAEDIDDAVNNLAQEAYRKAMQLVTEYRVALDALVDALLDKETLSGPEFRRLLSKFVQIPQENRVARDEPVLA